MIDVLVNGAAGKMGREVVKALTAADGIRVVAAVDPGRHGCPLDDGAGDEVTCDPDLPSAIATSRPAVMVDFTHPASVEASCATALAAGVHCVVGTTGLSR
ncbi:MAG TPA: 4-hydroxy-tetrahydrodipicolinate reductase, partial [Coriobacteriia bacterium]|nr:4-hydroxy-tetrahydrodipicolinate reductase [Coriobacteriia bacterium]